MQTMVMTPLTVAGQELYRAASKARLFFMMHSDDLQNIGIHPDKINAVADALDAAIERGDKFPELQCSGCADTCY